MEVARILPGATRTKEMYEEDLARVNENPYDGNRKTQTGIAGDCVLHSSCNFRLYNNWVLDILHDLFEGIVEYTLKLVLNQFIIVRKLCTIEDLNRRIHSFVYGLTDVRNKPSSNFTSDALKNVANHTLKQKGAQVWCLLRFFPFLFNHQLDRGDEYMELVLQLVRIVGIVVAPKIPRSILPYLTDLIEDHLHLFRQLFPNMPFINKHHHLTHMPECIRQTGSLVRVWTMRFEAANAILNRHGKVMCNFQNAPKTLVRVGQFQQMEAWGQCSFGQDRIACSQGSNVEVRSLSCAENLKEKGFKDSDKIFSTERISVKGTIYKVSMYVCVEASRTRDSNLPLFGKIEEIVVIQQTSVFFMVSLFEPICYDPDFHAYPILRSSRSNQQKLLEVKELADFKPLSVWKSPDAPDRIFLSFHHYVC